MPFLTIQIGSQRGILSTAWYTSHRIIYRYLTKSNQICNYPLKKDIFLRKKAGEEANNSVNKTITIFALKISFFKMSSKYILSI